MTLSGLEMFAIVLAAVAGGMASYFISVQLGKGPILGSAVVVLCSGLLFPALFGTLGTSIALAATTASYAGMVSTVNCRSPLEMTGISALAGLLFLASESVYPGVGGRLGTIAAIACFSYIGYREVAAGLMERGGEREAREERERGATAATAWINRGEAD